MKRVLVAVLALTVFAAVGAVAEDTHTGHEMAEGKWFDLKNCDFCKHLVEDETLLENMTWEHHDISNGVLTITVVMPEAKASYKKAHEGMMALSQKLESGKVDMADVNICGHCQHYGLLMQAGVNMEYVQSEAAEVVLMTASDEKTVKMIHTFAERNRTEYAKWAAEESAK